MVIGPTTDLRRLADELRERRGKETAPVLFLGRGVADAAQVPGLEDMARQLIIEAGPSEEGVVHVAKGDSEAVLDAFYEYWTKLSPIERNILLRRYYSQLAVPSFYQDLARLLAGRYFASVLTTSIDTLLEQALSAEGLRTGRDFVVISPTPDSRKPTYEQFGDREVSPLQIVKLHGDLSQRQVAITPEEIDAFLSPQRGIVKSGFLRGDIVLVGYEFESEPINQWLTWGSGILWWVNPERPSQKKISAIDAAHNIEYIDGENARPADLFFLLKYEFEGASMLEISEEMDQPQKTKAPTRRGMARGVQTPNVPAESELLRQKLMESQTRLHSLEQQAATMGTNSQVQRQMAYERSEIASTENALRGIAFTPEEIVALVRDVVAAAKRSGASPGAVSFLRSQVGILEKEYARQEADQDVIGAAIGGTVLLAERLGPEVVSPDLLQDLSSIAPSAVRRGRP